ncbi:endothelin-converting enzyme 1 [Dermacentor silvarum]|uniref:endothelin-converting enzyme 1 n=1 Tax=Dermacentor silvarum TaxID=543639 RepID=UPI001899CCA0|nr:endothelin-converting enzyme 1 [Dermacentor silvarum]
MTYQKVAHGLVHFTALYGKTNNLTTGKFDSRYSVVLLACGVVVLVSAFLVRAVLHSLRLEERAGGENVPPTAPCYGDHCTTSDQLFGNVSGQTVDPCEDFRSYVCSWWRPLDRFPDLAISAQSDLVVKWIEGFGSMLETGAAVDKSGVAQKALRFYRSCVTRTDRTQGDAEVFVAFIRTLGLTWPHMPPSNVSALGAILELNYRLALPLWFSLRVVPSAAKGGRRRLVLKPCCLGRLKFLMWQNQQAVDKGRYFDYWVAHYEALLGRKSLSRGRNEVNDLAREEAHISDKLAKLSDVSPSVPFLLHFSDIGSHTKHVSSNEWLAQVNKYIAGHVGDQAFTPEDEVFASDESVLSTIDDLFSHYAREKLVDHLSWQFVQMHAWIVDSTLLEMWGPNYWHIYEPILCARETEGVYRPVIAALYAEQRTTPQERSELDANLTDIKDVAARMFASSSWIDQTSKYVATKKLSAMSVGLWPPEPFFDQSRLETMYADFSNENTTEFSWVRLWTSTQELMRSLSGTSLHDVTVNMRSALFPFLFDYDYLMNRVDVAVSALAKPLYCPQGTPGMYYGSLAFAFTLAMMKMQDLTGLKLYSNGELVEAGRWSWLLDSTAKAYKQKMECLGEEPVSLSDIAAFEVIHAAFSRGMSNSTSLVQISRDIDERRTFFMAICLHSCSVENRRSPTANCNALLRNSRDFSEVFHCEVGSRMNPFNKCSFFK